MDGEAVGPDLNILVPKGSGVENNLMWEESKKDTGVGREINMQDTRG